jgi:hypothetical protein
MTIPGTVKHGAGSPQPKHNMIGTGESLCSAKSSPSRMKPKNEAAQALGRLAKGVPKHYTAEEIEKRTARLVLAREKRWPKKETKQ